MNKRDQNRLFPTRGDGWIITPDGDCIHKDWRMNMDGEYELRQPTPRRKF